MTESPQPESPQPESPQPESPQPESPQPAAAKPSKRRRWGRTALEVLAIGAIYLAIRGYQTRNLVVGEAPELPATLIDGAPSPEAPVVVHFFASWCGVCEMEAGNIRTLADHYPVLAIASQSGEADAVRDYLAEHDLGAAAIALDSRGTLAQRFGVNAFPATFFLDEAGHIVASEVGYTSTLGLLLRGWWAR